MGARPTVWRAFTLAATLIVVAGVVFAASGAGASPLLRRDDFPKGWVAVSTPRDTLTPCSHAPREHDPARTDASAVATAAFRTAPGLIPGRTISEAAIAFPSVAVARQYLAQAHAGVAACRSSVVWSNDHRNAYQASLTTLPVIGKVGDQAFAVRYSVHHFSGSTDWMFARTGRTVVAICITEAYSARELAHYARVAGARAVT